MSFPVRCYQVQRGPLGEDLEATIKRSSRELEHSVIEATVKAAAWSVGVQIGLMFLGPIGMAVSALMSVVQLITGRIYQKAASETVARTMDEVKKRGDAATKIMQEEGGKIYQEELPAARILAMSDQPLDKGLGGFSLKRIVKKTVSNVKNAVTKPVGKALSKFDDVVLQNEKLQSDWAGALIRPVVRAVGNTAMVVARTLENANISKEGSLTKAVSKGREDSLSVATSVGKLINPMTASQETVGLVAKHGGQAVAAVMTATGNEKGAAEVKRITGGVHEGAQQTVTMLTPAGSVNMFTGREGLLATREECEKLRIKAFASIDKMRVEGIAKMKSPEGRKAMRISIAQKLRDDPVFSAQLQELREIEAAERAALNTKEAQLTALVGPAPSSNSAGTFVGVAAAIGAAFAFTR